jgi:hypothetical protein
MHAVSRVSSVSSARPSAPAYRVISQTAAVRRTQPANGTSDTIAGAARQSTVLSSAQNTSSAQTTTSDLPLGLLQSVVQPPSSNSQASLDYSEMRTDLDSNNLTAAQQAYLRMQTDLYMPQQLSAVA